MSSVFNRQKERSGQLSRARQCIARQPLLCMAFAFYWLWVNMVNQTPLVFPHTEILPGLAIPSRLGPVFVSILAYLALSFWFKRSNAVIRKNWYLILLVVLMSIGSLLSVLWGEVASYALLDNAAASGPSQIDGAVPAFSFVLYLMASLLIGVPSACLCIETQRVFGHLGSQYVLFIGCFGMLVSSMVIFVLSFSPTFIQQVVLVLSPFPIAYGLRRTVSRNNFKGFFSHGLNAQLYTPYKFLITAVLHGLTMGTIIGYLSIHASQEVMVSSMLLIYAAAAILLFVISVLFRLDYNHLIYQIGFPLAAVGAALTICIDSIPLLGALIQLMGFCFLHLVMWGVCTYMIKNLNLPATWVIATSTCAFMCGQFIGAVASTLVSNLPEALGGIRSMETVLLFTLLLSSLLLMSNSNLKTGWGLSRFGSNELSDADSETAIRGIIVEHGLTKREADTLALMVRGKSRKAIGEELFVSEETIKSHAQSIYNKLGVHSQQELIGYFDECRMQIRCETPTSQFE
jgi:DNA-binding CsgD family transcriptional regulator